MDYLDYFKLPHVDAVLVFIIKHNGKLLYCSEALPQWPRYSDMMTPSNENIFHVTSHSCGESIGPR